MAIKVGDNLMVVMVHFSGWVVEKDNLNHLDNRMVLPSINKKVLRVEKGE